MIRKSYKIIRLILIFTCLSFSAGANSSFKLESPAFKNNAEIPLTYAVKGKDISPPLAWNHIPKNTRSLALVCDDPDVEEGAWDHWILYNIPPTMNHLEEAGKNLTSDIHLGKNSEGNAAYTGPNPPSGTHHYRFTLYALDSVLDLKQGATKEELHKAIKGHILGQAVLTGLFHP